MPLRPRSIEVYGKSWSRRGPGGTYYTARIYVNGEHLYTSPMQWGTPCLHVIREWLDKAGYLPGILPGEFLREYCVRIGCEFFNTISDVRRERDLDPPFDAHRTNRLTAITRHATRPHGRCERAGRCVENEQDPQVEACR